jgi:hypothetical protein
MAAAPQLIRSGEVDIRNLVRDGHTVATLMAIDQGDAFTVVTEVFLIGTDGRPGKVFRRPYTFPDATTGLAFLSDAVTSFTYLGCEIRHQ